MAVPCGERPGPPASIQWAEIRLLTQYLLCTAQRLKPLHLSRAEFGRSYCDFSKIIALRWIQASDPKENQSFPDMASPSPGPTGHLSRMRLTMGHLMVYLVSVFPFFS